jgi:hypothetical protein
MDLPSYFTDFLKDIRPTQHQRDDASSGVRVLRERLLADDDLAPCIVSTFLQGSHRRATAVRPHEGTRSDVDLVVVTRLARAEHPPERVVEILLPFVDTWYAGKYEINDRSIGISLSYVDLDLVMTSAPSEEQAGLLASEAVTSDATPEDEGAKDWQLNRSWVAPDHRSGWDAACRLVEAATEPQWKTEPLYIPSRDLRAWEATDPLAQIRWTWDKNRATGGHYVNVLKALKWWRRLNPEPKYPKGYPLEHLVGACSPDAIGSVAEGVVRTLENIRDSYRWHVQFGLKPALPDHGVPEHDVLARVSAEDFAGFHALATTAATLARAAYDAGSVKDSADGWRRLFGEKFPPAPDRGNGDTGGGGASQTGGFVRPTAPAIVTGGRFG